MLPGDGTGQEMIMKEYQCFVAERKQKCSEKSRSPVLASTCVQHAPAETGLSWAVGLLI